VAVHAHGTSGIKDAIRAGVDTIEHASLADEEAFALAKQRGTYFDMDIYNDDYILAEGEKTAHRNGATRERPVWVDDGHTVIAQTETVIIAACMSRDRAPSRRPKIDRRISSRSRDRQAPLGVGILCKSNDEMDPIMIDNGDLAAEGVRHVRADAHHAFVCGSKAATLGPHTIPRRSAATAG
jgi:hypothetical protein